MLDVIEESRALKDNPRLGFSFGGKYGFGTPYRGLVCGKYIVVYEPIDACAGETGRIEARRVYHCREDYLRQLQQE